MKKLLLTLALLSTPALADTPIEKTAIDRGYVKNVAGAKAVADLVKLYGYRCDSITSFRKSLWDSSYVIICNDYRYEYIIEDKGGRWTVTVD